MASGLEITPAKSEGFGSWKKIANVGWGIANALDNAISVGAVYDRDFFPDQQISEVRRQLTEDLRFAHIHDRKEIENFLLMPAALERAVSFALHDRAKREEKEQPETPNVRAILEEVMEGERVNVFSQRIAREVDYRRSIEPKLDTTTLQREALQACETAWKCFEERLALVPGKVVLQLFRERVANEYGISLTNARIIGTARADDIPADLQLLIEKLDAFRLRAVT